MIFKKEFQGKNSQLLEKVTIMSKVIKQYTMNIDDATRILGKSVVDVLEELLPESGTLVKDLPKFFQGQHLPALRDTGEVLFSVENNGNPTVFKENTRIAVAVGLVANGNIYSFDRKKNENLTTIHNHHVDAIGAVGYALPSLPYKVTEEYILNARIDTVVLVGFAVELLSDGSKVLMPVYMINLSESDEYTTAANFVPAMEISGNQEVTSKLQCILDYVC